MDTYLWSLVIRSAYRPKALKEMVESYRQGMQEREFLRRYARWDGDESDRDEFRRVESELGFKVVSIYGVEYPDSLRGTFMPPPALYCIGDTSLLNRVLVGVVGSRKAPGEAVIRGERLGDMLEKKGLLPVSGLAVGIDASVHRGARRSIGVIGCGIDRIYPLANRLLFEKVKKEGCLVSEFPLGMAPLAWHFPRRNRLIAGLSCFVCVVHGRPGSGALITLDAALEEGREVFVEETLVEEGIAVGFLLKELEILLDRGI